MSVHIHSLLAFYANQRKFTRRENEILGVFVRNNNQPLTDRQIKAVLQYADMNAIRPRCSELVDDNILMEVGSVVCPVTRKTVRLLKIREREEGQAMLNFATPA